MVYLDYAASSPTEKEVLASFYTSSLKYYANPNSSHKLGLEAKQEIDDCTKKIANLLHVYPEEIIYTSGATEANNLAIKGVCERYKSFGHHVLVSPFEHNSIMASLTSMQEKGFEIEVLPVTKEGKVDTVSLKDLLREDTILVSVCSVDSELGICQPIEKIAQMLKEYPNVVFHTDASQAIGKTTIDYQNVDLITINPHKFGGLNGTGMLIKKKRVSLCPQIEGGKSTTIYRSGTPVVGNVVATLTALTIALDKEKERTTYVKTLYDKVKVFLENYENVHINNTTLSLPFFLNFSIKNQKAQEFVKLLEKHEVYLSAKTSCCPIETPSKLVYALTKDKTLAMSSLRLSLSHFTTKEDLNEFYEAFDLCYKETFHGKI